MGHVADSQYLFCSIALGEKTGVGRGENQSRKADLIAALKEAFAYCDQAYDGLTDVTAVQPIKLFGNDAPTRSAGSQPDAQF